MASMLAVAALMAALPASAQKLGLSSSFGDVTVQNMKLGAAYPIRKLKGHGYNLTNISEIPVELVVDVVPPIQGSLRPLYEDIPDVSWVKVTPRQFKLEPGATADSEVTVRVPEDGNWKDRNFQASLYAHTLQGSFVNVGLYDKLFFSTGAGPEAMKSKGPRVELVPASLKLGKARAGRTHLSSALAARLRVRNVGDAPRTLTASVLPFDAAHPAPKGWTAGDAAAVKFDGAAITVAANATVDVPFSLELPKEAAGKRLAFRIGASAEGPDAASATGALLVEVTGEPAAVKKAPAKAMQKK